MATFENVGYFEVAGPTFGGTADTDYDSTFCDGSYIVEGLNCLYSRLSTDQTEAWFHVVVNFGDYAAYTEGEGITLYDDFGKKIITTDGVNDAPAAYYALGGSLIQFPNGHIPGGKYGGPGIYDFHAKIDSVSGAFEIFYNGALIRSYYGDTEGTDTGRKISYAFLKNHSNGVGNLACHYSEPIWGVGNSPTVGLRVATHFPTGNSATNTAWDGGYTDVASVSGVEGKWTLSDAASERQGYTFPSLDSAVGENAVRSLVVHTKGLSYGIRSYKPSLRVSSTDYDGTDASASGVLADNEEEWATNPNTTNPWTKTEVNATEVGVIST